MIETTITVERRIKTSASKALYEEAREYAVGGVQGKGKWYAPHPLFIKRALGDRIWDVDGNEFIDYWGGAGPIIIGHSDPEVNAAVFETISECGTNYCQPHPREVELAKKLRELIPSAEQSGFCNAGSDALLYIIRLARAYTGRPKIVKFEGSYQGWSDSAAMSVFSRRENAGAAQRPATVPETAGLLPGVVENTIVLPYNNADVVADVVKEQKGQIAAILVEPMIASSNILAQEGFLQALRQICDANDILLVFDEVVTGFRHCLGGLQSLFNVTPDVSAFGKAMANGWFIAAVCGKKKYMSSFTPEGPVLINGTYNGSVANVAASLKTIEILSRPGFYEYLHAIGAQIRDGINAVIQEFGINAHCGGYGAVWCLSFSELPLVNYRDLLAIAANNGDAKNAAYRNWLLNHGIFLLPQKVNRGYLYAAHSVDDVQKTVDVTAAFLKEHRAALM